MTTQHISVTVNGAVHEADVEPRLLLVHFLDPDHQEGCIEFRIINEDVAACSRDEPHRELPETMAPMCYIYLNPIIPIT